MAQPTTEKPKGMLTPETDSNDPYSNQFPITGPADDRYNNTDRTSSKKTGDGMADIGTENASTEGIDILVDIDQDQGAGMKDGGLIGNHTVER